MDELVTRGGLRTPFVRMAQDGEVLAPSGFTGSGGVGAEVGDQVLDERVLERYAGGATLVLQGLHRLWPPLTEFAGELATQLGHPVQVNAYLTPPGATGFAAHYDVHDVFVLQVAGDKRWVVHEPVHPLPLRTEPWTDRRAAVAATARQTEPVLATVLRPGDALYLPRGYLHAAEAQAGRTLHLTVGVPPLTRYAVAEVLLGLVAADPLLRAALPVGLDFTDDPAVHREVAATLAALRAALPRVDPAAVAGELRRRSWASGRPAPLRPVAQAAAAQEAGPASVVRRRRRLPARLLDRAGRVVLELPDREISFPEQVRAALGALLGGEPQAAGRLPGLDPGEGVVLVRRLLREGVLVPADPP